MDLRLACHLDLIIELQAEVSTRVISHQHVQLVVHELHPLHVLVKLPLAPAPLDLLLSNLTCLP